MAALDPKDAPRTSGGQPSGAQSVQDVLGSLQGLFNSHELQVLGAMGLLTGYICVFFAKILNLTNPYTAVSGVACITFLLLAINKDFNWRASVWWIRSFVIIIICLLITAPQLFYAWTVSVAEARSAAEELHQRDVKAAVSQVVHSDVTVSNINSQ
jgi:hypothetical protein